MVADRRGRTPHPLDGTTPQDFGLLPGGIEDELAEMEPARFAALLADLETHEYLDDTPAIRRLRERLGELDAALLDSPPGPDADRLLHERRAVAGLIADLLIGGPGAPAREAIDRLHESRGEPVR